MSKEIPTHLIPADYQDAIDNAGWTNGRQSYQRGYVSRKVSPNKAKLQQNKKGEWYVLLASYKSTQFCIRQYLNP